MSKTAGGTGWGRMKRKNEQKAPATPSRHFLGPLCVRAGRVAALCLGVAWHSLPFSKAKMCRSRQGALIPLLL